ncbi:hypothetical protein RJ55_04452 [Drechmeria coniospora]|nr:hypothetical protein RJ55_04452 [Drechmeria coniospora]
MTPCQLRAWGCPVVLRRRPGSRQPWTDCHPQARTENAGCSWKHTHSFDGNNESFRSFPARVQALLRIQHAGSHIIRFKMLPSTERAEAWTLRLPASAPRLCRRPPPQTSDLIPIRHSIRGLLVGEVGLMVWQPPENDEQAIICMCSCMLLLGKDQRPAPASSLGSLKPTDEPCHQRARASKCRILAIMSLNFPFLVPRPSTVCINLAMGRSPTKLGPAS